MAEESAPPPMKKRRIPKACTACRKSKLRCDERRPCSRCFKTGVECEYFERPKDPNVLRIERLENELNLLSRRLNPTSTERPSPSTTHSLASFECNSQQNGFVFWSEEPITRQAGGFNEVAHPLPAARQPSSGLVGFTIREPSAMDVVSSGNVLETDAKTWFSAFFEGCDRFVPVFDSTQDTYNSVRGRSSSLFDVIVIFGARAAHGVISKPYQRLYPLLRQHTSDLVLRLSCSSGSTTSIEDIQALLVIASYSDSGAVLCDVALRAALEADLPRKLDSLFQSKTDAFTQPQQSSLGLARVWYYLYVLDMILSLDGGKPTSISLDSTSSRRIRMLLSHPQRNALDIRLFAQVELNTIRSGAHASLARDISGTDMEFASNNIIRGTMVDLDLWLSEWQGFALSNALLGPEQDIMLLNLKIQHAWAVLTLHLRAITSSGIDNVALMTNSQRSIALAAKAAGERHLKLLLTKTATSQRPGNQEPASERPYISNFRYAMEFVWAKNAFCILIVLRLSILLGDPPGHLIERLSEAKEFSNELDKVGMGSNVNYARILSQTVEKCEQAVQSSLQSTGDDAGDGDFQSFIPKEFMFDWDFPGLRLHLSYLPLDWQLFLDFGATSQITE